MTEYPKYKVGAVQAAPVYHELDKTIEKACGFIREAAADGARVIGFPEGYVPGYPWWVWQKPSEICAKQYGSLLHDSMVIGSDAFKKLAVCARENHIYVCIPVHEKVNDSLYMTQLWFDDNGNLMGKHRKMKATAAEKKCWTDGDGSTALVYDTPLGKMGSMMCGEHHVPAYRAVLGAQGEQLHVAGWPPLPIELPGHMGLTGPLNAVKALCIENKCFAIFSTLVINQQTLDRVCGDDPVLISKMPTSAAPFGGKGGGAACVLNPLGQVISGDFLDPCLEGIAYGEVDLAQCIQGKMLCDVHGNSMKANCMKFSIDRSRELPMINYGEQPDNTMSYEEICAFSCAEK